MSIPNAQKGYFSDHTKTFSAISGIAVDISSTDHTPAKPARGIYVGGAGNLVCVLVGDDATNITFTGLLAGSWYPFAIKTVVKASTTITNSVLLF